MAIISSKGGQKVDILSGELVFDKNNNRLVLDDGNVFRMVIGRYPNGDIGVAISVEGVDVLEELSNA